MHSYTVHLPANKTSREEQLKRAVFVSDGFHFVALIAAPVWLLWHRQWLGLLLYAAALVLFEYSTDFVSSWALGIVNLLFGIGVALEASTFRRWRLEARGWRIVDAFAAHDLDDAEQRFFKRLKEPHLQSAAGVAPAKFSSTPTIIPTSTVIGYQ